MGDKWIGIAKLLDRSGEGPACSVLCDVQTSIRAVQDAAVGQTISRQRVQPLDDRESASEHEVSGSKISGEVIGENAEPHVRIVEPVLH
jgi:hypothetical protein